jgi:hypothetical protein
MDEEIEISPKSTHIRYVAYEIWRKFIEKELYDLEWCSVKDNYEKTRSKYLSHRIESMRSMPSQM